MEPLEIASKLKERFASEVLEVVEFRGQGAAVVKRGRILELCRFLREDPALRMDFLSDLCGADYPGRELRFEVVYNLLSLTHSHRFRLKAQVPESDPRIASVVPVWRGAEWHEREVYDMFGVVFEGHPDPRRILMPDDWEGHPLRKDYPLELPADREYRGLVELRELHTRDDEWRILA